jgi:hypothetical protein
LFLCAKTLSCNLMRRGKLSSLATGENICQ